KGRIGQVRQQVDLEVAQRDQPEQDERQRHHRDRDATADRSLDQVHGWATDSAYPKPWAMAALGGGFSTCSSVPSRTATLPVVTTCSPSARPETTSATSPLTWPSCTSWRTALPSRTANTAGSPWSCSSAERGTVSTSSRRL